MASALIKEIANAQGLFALRSRDYPGYEQIAKDLPEILIQQVNRCLHLTVQDASLVMHALKDSPYADADLKRIAVAINAKVLMRKPSKAAPVKDQICQPADFKHEVMDKPKVEHKGIKRDADSCQIAFHSCTMSIPLMPKESKDGNPAPVQYLGGVIYTRQDRCQFLVVKKNKVFGCEIPWGGGVTKKEAWDECIDAIQAHEQ